MQTIEGKRICVTGGHGFLGSKVVNKLKEKKAKEVIIPRSNSHDLRDMKNALEVVKECDMVLHLAAVVGGIGANRENPAKFFYDNLLMGINVVEACRRSKVEKTLILGTICAYPKFTPVPFKEKNLWNGYPEETNAPYGIAKKTLLVMSQAYRQQYNMNSIFLLPVNLYGPGDNFDMLSSHVIPAMIRKFYQAKIEKKSEVILWGDGSPTREFLYVEDAAEGIVLATEKYEGSEPINLGSGNEISILNLANTIKESLNFKGKILWDSEKPNGQPRRCLDVSRAKKKFGFSAKTPFKKGLANTIKWYEDNYNSILKSD